MIPNKVYDILINLLPMIVLFSIVMILIRVISSLYAKDKIIVYKEIKNLIYIIYCFALFKLVTTTDFSSYSHNFTLFKEIMRYQTDSMLFFRNVIGNILLFVPFGYLITDMIHEKANKCNIFITTFIVIVTSLAIEVIQMFIGRSFDIDDILLNAIGGIVGYISYKLIHLLFKILPDKYTNNFTKGLIYIIISTLFVITFCVLYTMR